MSTRRVFWAAVWLAIVLVAIKAYYLGIPAPLALTDFGNYLRSLAAISYGDVLFAAMVPEKVFHQGRNKVELFDASGGTLRSLGAV